LTRPWQTLEAVETPEGRLELRRRGESEFVITVGGRVLMSSAAHRTEAAAAELACREIAGRYLPGVPGMPGVPGGPRRTRGPRGPRILIGGLGMAFTLRAALDALPSTAQVVVAEIDPTVVAWCRGPLAPLTGRAVDDPRVEIALADVAEVIAGAARGGSPPFDAVVLDLYEGPRAATQGEEDPFYGRGALARTRAALAPGGVFAVWSEDPDAPFERRLGAAGFRVELRRPGRGGPRHAVYLARA